jgi:DNA-binding NtrC family response regulator
MATGEAGTLAAGGSLAELERQTIVRTLADVGGNRRLAATKLGIGLRTLYEKLKRYDLH